MYVLLYVTASPSIIAEHWLRLGLLSGHLSFPPPPPLAASFHSLIPKEFLCHFRPFTRFLDRKIFPRRIRHQKKPVYTVRERGLFPVFLPSCIPSFVSLEDNVKEPPPPHKLLVSVKSPTIMVCPSFSRPCLCLDSP